MAQPYFFLIHYVFLKQQIILWRILSYVKFQSQYVTPEYFLFSKFFCRCFGTKRENNPLDTLYNSKKKLIKYVQLNGTPMCKYHTVQLEGNNREIVGT